MNLLRYLKGSKDGERIRKIMAEGGLVPFELTVQILINGLIANPSKVFSLVTLLTIHIRTILLMASHVQ